MAVETVEIAFVAPAFVCFPVWVAQERGLFEASGVDCAVDIVGTTDGVTQALTSGRSQLAIGPAEGFALLASAGSPFGLIAANANRAPLRLVADPSISSIGELRGKRLGTSSLGEGTATIIKTMLAAHGLSYPEDYEFVLAGAHPQRWEALQAGHIDACLQLIPFDYIAEDAGYRVLGAASDYMPDYVFSAVAADLQWARTRPQTVTGLLSALSKATDWAGSHRDEAAAIIARATRSGPAHARRGLDYMLDDGVVSADLHINRDGLEAVFAAMRAGGLTTDATVQDYEICVSERFLPD
jgi:ABC-type nitrate/sulfonate/bicarbonate transport system substrate-binding protein